MKRLLRKCATRDYLGKDGNWTNVLSEAADFPDVKSLLQAALLLPEAELEQVLMMEEQPSGRDLALPLRIKN